MVIRIFYANIGTRTPMVHSFAHGERNFFLFFDYDDLKNIIEESSVSSLKNWAPLLANGHLNDEEREELVKMVHKKKNGDLKTMRVALKEAMAAKKNPSEFGTPDYITPEYAFLNLCYGVVMMGSKAVIIEEIFDDGLKFWRFETHRRAELLQYWENVLVLQKDGRETVNIFSLWMKSTPRNTYSGIQFRPDPTIFRADKRII